MKRRESNIYLALLILVSNSSKTNIERFSHGKQNHFEKRMEISVRFIT